jgi:uncharacterized lipoprotein YmbA
MNQMRILLLFILTLLAYGCFSASPPTRIFVLSATELQEVESKIKVRIGRVVLPHYLKRWELVTMANEREVRINDFAQWGELLEEGVKRIMTENFCQLLGNEQVFSFNSPPEADCWRLDYDFLALFGNEKGALLVKVICHARNADTTKRFSIAFELPCVAAKSDEQLIKAHEEGLARLALETLSHLQAVEEHKPAK